MVMLATVVAMPACTSTRTYVAGTYADWEHATPPPDAQIAHRIFLIGDAGASRLDPLRPTLRLLKTQVEQRAGPNDAVVFLGDNLYCCGLGDSAAADRPRQEERLLAQLKVVENFEGPIVFIPGNHDWNDGRPGGLEAVRRQERFIEERLGTNAFLPDDGFPGPVEVELSEYLVLVALDTQWWLHRYEKSYGDTGEYDLEEDANFLFQIDDLMKRRDDATLIVLGHHPLFSNGPHAGMVPLREHLFPLTELHRALLVPLPLIGSAYPLYLRYFGGRQDLPHPRYRALRTALTQTFLQHEALIYAAGHDHSLQYFKHEAQHYLVSGSGIRTEPVGRGRGAAFTYGGHGHAVLNVYEDGTVWVEFWAPEDDGTTGTLLFRTQVKGPTRELVDPEVPADIEPVDYSDSTVVMAVNPNYLAGDVKELFLGSHHREAWATPVEAPVLDLGTEHGGLTPVKRGGGQQTISLRLQGGDGHEYVLRSIDKDPSGTVPVNLQGTVATDIVQDQIASLHPFGAFIIPRLADAAGIYHTNPKLVYVPHDPRLGIYEETFGGHLMMLEERPDDDMTGWPSSGNSEDVESASTLYREVTDDNDHRIDQRFFARSRLFDMWLSDWDRHKGQWRWASFEPYELDPSLDGEARTQGKIYRPIPRDRDFAFNTMNGLFPSLMPFFDPKFQDFSEHYGYLKGLNLNGLPQDRRFLNQLTRSDWIEIADSLRAALTDAVIDQAVRDWPEAIYERDGAETARLLKIRRDKLTDVAEAFYEIHAKVVDVVGSNKHERFEITRLNDDSTRVVVYKTSKEGEVRKIIYKRTFLGDETQEIRLYGFDGNDTFIADGAANDGIRITAVGGPGEDTFIDRSRVGGWGHQMHVYDTATGTTVEPGPETKMTLSDDDPGVNFYDPLEYQYDLNLPLLFFGRNDDDGLFVGGGVNMIRHGFRKKPYAATHRLKGNLAAKTLAFNVVYEGHYVDLFGRWDGTLDAEFLSPNNIRNFFGLGNESENERNDREFYQARLTQVRLAPSLQLDTELGASLRFGPTFQFTKIREDEDRFLAVQPGVSQTTFEDQWFGGVVAEMAFETVDTVVNPKLGARWSNAVELNVGLRNASETFSRLRTDLAVYISPSLSPQITLAARVGASHNVGDFPFYSANTLGGADNLRGHRSTRFTGRTALYQNLELRLELFRFSTYLAIGKAGLYGFLDNGRVWTEADDALDVSQSFVEGYHQGYGGGVWFELFNLFVLQGGAGFSADDTTVTIGLGFQY